MRSATCSMGTRSSRSRATTTPPATRTPSRTRCRSTASKSPSSKPRCKSARPSSCRTSTTRQRSWRPAARSPRPPKWCATRPSTERGSRMASTPRKPSTPRRCRRSESSPATSTRRPTSARSGIRAVLAGRPSPTRTSSEPCTSRMTPQAATYRGFLDRPGAPAHLAVHRRRGRHDRHVARTTALPRHETRGPRRRQPPRHPCLVRGAQAQNRGRAPSIRFRTFFTDQHSAKVRESEGIAAAFRKHFDAYSPKNGTSKDVLQKMVEERAHVG
jgi:hypothetical protein